MLSQAVPSEALVHESVFLFTKECSSLKRVIRFQRALSVGELSVCARRRCEAEITKISFAQYLECCVNLFAVHHS